MDFDYKALTAPAGRPARSQHVVVLAGATIVRSSDAAVTLHRTADVVLMRSDPLDVPIALQIGRGTRRKMRQNLTWAVGYNAIALPIAAGVFAPQLCCVPR